MISSGTSSSNLLVLDDQATEVDGTLVDIYSIETDGSDILTIASDMSLDSKLSTEVFEEYSFADGTEYDLTCAN